MYICKDCFQDEELRSAANSNVDHYGVCDACGIEGPLIEFSFFDDFFGELLSLFSESETSHRTVVDIIQEEWNLFCDNNVAHLLLANVVAAHNYKYSTNSFVDYSTDIIESVAIWEDLKFNVKEKSRFFTNIDNFTKGRYLELGDNPLKIGSKLYRSRITPVGESVLRRKDMGCPPKAMSTAGRANPIGIPYLYLCDTPKTTYYEVRAVYLDRLSVGTFKVTRELNTVDFTHRVNLYLSFVNGATLSDVIIRKKIIDAISKDLSKPLRRYDSELEYVPTQFICEYCKNELHADGIIFESSLHKGGRNYVLFDESSVKCTKVETHEITRIDIDIV